MKIYVTEYKHGKESSKHPQAPHPPKSHNMPRHFIVFTRCGKSATNQNCRKTSTNALMLFFIHTVCASVCDCDGYDNDASGLSDAAWELI